MRIVRRFWMNAIYIIATASALLSSASSAQNTEKTKIEPPFSQGLELPAGKYAPGYNGPAFIDVQGWNFDVWGSFTYWNISQDVMNVGYNFPIQNASPSLQVTSTIVSIENVWEPGFKVGIAYNIDYDGWVGSAEYTWVRSSANVSAHNTTGSPLGNFTGTGLLLDFVSPSNVASTLDSSWKMNLDLVDVLFSRPFYEGTRITTTPFAGLRALFIRQHQSVNMFVPASGDFSTATKTNCWSLGPVAGFSGHWLLGKGIRFEGSTAASLLYTNYTEISTDLTTPGNLSAPSKLNDFHELRPTAEIGVGLGWGSYIYNGNYFIDFSARYEFKYFWDQNVYRQFGAILADDGADALGALMLHGFTLTGGFDF